VLAFRRIFLRRREYFFTLEGHVLST
jgi:hypothetical protein